MRGAEMSTLQTVKCPYCQELIQAGASKCRYCKEWLDPRPKEETPPPNEPRVLARRLRDSKLSKEEFETERKIFLWQLAGVALFVVSVCLRSFANATFYDTNLNAALIAEATGYQVASFLAAGLLAYVVGMISDKRYLTIFLAGVIVCLFAGRALFQAIADSAAR